MRGYVSKRYLSEKFDSLARDIGVLMLGEGDQVNPENHALVGERIMNDAYAIKCEVLKGFIDVGEPEVAKQ